MCLRAYQLVEQAAPGHFEFQISLDYVTHSKHPQGVYSLVRGWIAICLSCKQHTVFPDQLRTYFAACEAIRHTMV